MICYFHYKAYSLPARVITLRAYFGEMKIMKNSMSLKDLPQGFPAPLSRLVALTATPFLHFSISAFQHFNLSSFQPERANSCSFISLRCRPALATHYSYHTLAGLRKLGGVACVSHKFDSHALHWVESAAQECGNTHLNKTRDTSPAVLIRGQSS